MADQWYVIQTYSGQEAKVTQYIRDFIDSEDNFGGIKEVLMPTRDVVQVKGGKKVKTTRKFFPSYLLVNMEMSKDTVHFIRGIKGVLSFVGGRNPKPVKEDEIRRILGQTEKNVQKDISEILFETGDAVKIKEGPFKDFDGVVDEIHPEKGRVKVMVSVFGRLTPVELDFVQVNPLT